MAIGRLQAALAAATNEVTVAAANINFNFTLIKCKAPKEYQALRNALSKKHKENAEFGSSRVLARQLGALFDGVCPSAPALLEAYIGKPGLNFLLPPKQPIMRDIDAGNWKVDSYDRFDGSASHSFENTSMHLSFTDYLVPPFDGLRGAYDSQIYFLESVISVQDKGEWIANVDP
ncbi:hypothetical protein GGP41_003823 [Bipolaris sorokiniana]|uniref:Uncharacterized protein n=2 Tax=Cochliobolus sativus TaxID=45130 RepID=A0A8H5ZBR2_COCSA|nr:uncharacterized protein COCSADRAFT_160160 [Bipolaris sorokiniana ND90Pr]EMD65184.1 hypothetical protein COCSADRAFT_160160 [Bipolaris sorokiniana ND90Pr]KAF5846402.1 hypothetical protein GGP41_003823 [Bipolaris sorokiniana]